MSKQGLVVTGVVAFSNLTECDVYNGKSTGRYSVTVVIPEDAAARMSDAGVKVKTYKEKKQRKFATTFPPTNIVDLDGQRFAGEIPFGSTVRVLYTLGDASPEHGVPTYLEGVRVIELAEGAVDTPEEF